MSKEYEWMMRFLKNATAQQFLELFNDLHNFEVVEKIGDCAYFFIENWEPKDEENNYRELKQADDNQRYSDIKVTTEYLK